LLDRTDQGLTPRFLKGEPPSDAAIAAVVQTISRRVIRTLRHLGYLKAGIDAAGATGYDLLMDDEPALARTLAASVTQRLAAGRVGGRPRRAGCAARAVGQAWPLAGDAAGGSGRGSGAKRPFEFPIRMLAPVVLR
jgi:hypothetical protein